MALEEEIQKYRQEIKSQRMDMSFGEIINMYKEQEIIISPEYQRAFRWDEQRQSNFIESILLGIPFPSIFVATNQDGKWELIDGLQRVSTVLSFFNELKDKNGDSNKKNGLKLKECSMIKSLKDMTIDTIPLEYKLLIKRTPCRVEIILKESDFNMRYELFKRLNTGGEGLSRQEIRNCIFRGLDSKYSDFVSELSNNVKFREIVEISSPNIEMMYYEELVLRYLALKNEGTHYPGNNIQDFMDSYLKNKCENYIEEEVSSDRKTFTKIIEFLSSLKQVEIFKLGRRNFTTSMYDSVMLSLSEPTININDFYEKSDKFIANVNLLKEDEAFKKYTGSASSNPTSIYYKVERAKEILLNI